MIFVDSSVWISAFRDGQSPEARGLTRLLDSDEVALSIPVFLEILTSRGLGRENRYHLRRVLSALPVFYPSVETWARIGKWIDRAAHRGDQFGVRDLLVASDSIDRASRTGVDGKGFLARCQPWIPRAASQRSASMAALQPSPAA